MGTSAPKTSDIQNAATSTANQQQGLNTQSQFGSMFNQNNPYGNLNFVQTGTGPNGQPQYTATENFSPEQLQLYNQYQQTQALAGAGGRGVLAGANYGAQPASKVLGDQSSGLTRSFMDQWLSGVEPFYKTQQDQLQAQLANQGLSGPTISNPSGSPAYATALRQLQTNQANAVAQQSMAAQNQAWKQAVESYSLPADLAMKLSQFGAPTTPNASFNQGPAVQPSNLIAALQAQVPVFMQPFEAYQKYNNPMPGLFSLGSNVLGGLATGGMF